MPDPVGKNPNLIDRAIMRRELLPLYVSITSLYVALGLLLLLVLLRCP